MTKIKDKLSLRDLKFARTRYNILQSFLKLNAIKPYESINIEEICELAEISRGTFFNYFPSKDHVFTYYGWYASAEITIALNSKKSRTFSIYEKIKFVFDRTINEESKYEKLFPIFISHVLRRDFNIIYEMQFTKADLLYLYEDCEGFILEGEVVKLPTIAQIFSDLLQDGIEIGEFKSDINIRKVILQLLSLYFSPPIAYKFMREEYSLKEAYNLLLEDILLPILK